MQLPLVLIQNFSLTGLIKISSKHHLSFVVCNFCLSERKAQRSFPVDVYSVFVSVGKD